MLTDTTYLLPADPGGGLPWRGSELRPSTARRPRDRPDGAPRYGGRYSAASVPASGGRARGHLAQL